VWTLPALGQIDTPFETGCGPLPFQDIAVEHKGVDDVCGIGGVAGEQDIGNQQQNRIKNNFCLTGAPVAIKSTDLLTLQKKVDALDDFSYGSGRSVPKDRSPLQDLMTVNGEKVGEGTLVTITGYMIDPHYSDVRKGEGVNCKKSGNERNDIHFSISRIWHDIDFSDKKTAQLELCKLARSAHITAPNPGRSLTLPSWNIFHCGSRASYFSMPATCPAAPESR
jgi:hypothetical protein